MKPYEKNSQYLKFCLYGFLKNLRFYDAFLLLFLLENQLSFSQIGILYASKEIVTNVFEIPSGILADKYGRKNALLLAFLLYISAYLLFFVSTNFLLFLVAMLFIGIGDAFRSGANKGMIIDYLRINNWSEHKIDYYGNTRSWSQFGSAISAIFAGIMVFYSGSYRIIYLIAIIPYILNLINIYTYPKELNHSLKAKKQGATSLGAILKNSFVTIKKKRVLEIVNSSALHSAFLKSIKDYIQPLMINIALLIPLLTTIDDKNRSGLAIGIFYFFIFLLTSFASKYAGKFAALSIHKVQEKTLFLGLISGVFCGVLYQFEIWSLALVFFVGIYIIENLRKPILTGNLAENVPNEILTSVISTESFYKTLLSAALAVLLGVIADFRGIGMALISVSVLLLVLTLAIGWVSGSSKALK